MYKTVLINIEVVFFKFIVFINDKGPVCISFEKISWSLWFKLFRLRHIFELKRDEGKLKFAKALPSIRLDAKQQ